MKNFKSRSIGLFFNLALLFSAIVVTPGCKWFNKEVTGCSSCPHHSMPSRGGAGDANLSGKTISKDAVSQGPVLLSAKDKALLTKDEFEKYCTVVCDMEPQYKQIIEAIPESKMQLYKDLSTQKIIQEWANQKGLTESEDYKKKLSFQKEAIERNLALQEFQKHLQDNLLNFKDSELKSFYESEKTKNPVLQQAPFLEKEAGVLSKGVKFDNEEQAKQFLDKVKNQDLNLDEVAKKDSKKVEDFGAINEQSYSLDSNLRDKVLEQKDYPQAFVVKSDEENEYWVVKADSQQKAEYASFDKVKDEVKQAMMQAKAPEIAEKEIEKVKKEIGIKEETQSLEDDIKQQKEKSVQQMKAQQAMMQTSNTTNNNQELDDQSDFIQGA